MAVLCLASESDVWVQYTLTSSFLWATWELLLQSHLHCGQVLYNVSLQPHSQTSDCLVYAFFSPVACGKRHGGTEQPSPRVWAKNGCSMWLLQACFPTHNPTPIAGHFLSESGLSHLCWLWRNHEWQLVSTVLWPSCLHRRLSHNPSVLLSGSQSRDPATAADELIKQNIRARVRVVYMMHWQNIPCFLFLPILWTIMTYILWFRKIR